MLSTHFPRAHRRYTSLPVLGPLVDDFHTWLLECGFRRGRRKQHLSALWRIDRSLWRRGRHQWSEVTPEDLEACERHSADSWIVRNLRRFAEHAALLPPPEPDVPSRVELLTSAYAAMLRDVRGLALSTRHSHATTATAFLDHMAYQPVVKVGERSVVKSEGENVNCSPWRWANARASKP